MRRLQGVLVFAGLAGWLASDHRPVAHAQPAKAGPTYWANRKIDIPVNPQTLKKFHQDRNLPLPTSLHLYAARNGGEFVPARKLPMTGLDEIKKGELSGFWFTADKDGDYEFAVQFIYPDGGVSARAEDLRPETRIIIDTTPPVVQIRGAGNRVDWSITDENLDPTSIKLQCKLPSWTEWRPVTDRAMKATDRYGWELRPNEVLEVRVLARDRAGNEGVSSLVRLPTDGGGGGANPRPPGGNEWPPGGGGGGAVPNQPPRVLYVNTMEFDIDYTIQRMGRSGVKAAHLWVLKEQGVWSLAHTTPVDLPNGKDQNLALKYKAEREGTYGFFVIPESGAGEKVDPPRKDDPPQILVVVDTKAPAVKITGISVRGGGVRGPIVEINWEAGDQNLMPNSIDLEYSIDKAAPVWKEIKKRTSNQPNSMLGRIEWEVPDPEVWKFHVRIRATDHAGNTGQDIYGKEVIVDLEKPAAAIGGVRTSGTPHKPATDKLPPATGGGSGGLPKGSGSGPEKPEVPDLPGGGIAPPPRGGV